jgi:hypothetical protein
VNSFNRSISHNGPERKDENGYRQRRSVNGEHFDRGGSAKASPNLIGSDLSPADYSALATRWIDRDLADAAGLRRVDSLTGGDVVGRKSGNYAGIVIPYFYPGSTQVREYRLRRDQPHFEYDAGGNLKPRQKYLSAPGRANMLYVIADVERSLLADPELTIVITEGEFKTLALWRLANYQVSGRSRFLPLGLPGVYNWRGTIGKNDQPRWDANRRQGHDSGPRLDRVAG